MQSGKASVKTCQREGSLAWRVSQLHHIFLTLQMDRFAIKLREQDPVLVLLIERERQHSAAQR
jgi:hypothetical protein